MAQENAARFFKAVQEDKALQGKFRAITDANTFVSMAEQQGYNFTIEELQNELEKLSEEEVASVVNPGIGPRRHLLPR